MTTYFISDLHIGHKNILNHSPKRGGTNIDEHDAWIVDQWNSVIKSKKDLVWVLGDVCFDKSKMHLVGQMNGRKKLLRGNHDTFAIEIYLEYFEKIYGIHKKYSAWLTHAPIHPESLRNLINIHGHVHDKTLNDSRYINVCVEALDGKPISIESIRKRLDDKEK